MERPGTAQLSKLEKIEKNYNHAKTEISNIIIFL